MPLGAVPALPWCGEVSLEGKHIIITQRKRELLILILYIFRVVPIWPHLLLVVRK